MGEWTKNRYEQMLLRWANLAAAQRWIRAGSSGLFRVVEIGVAEGYTANLLIEDLIFRRIPYEYIGIDNLGNPRTMDLSLKFAGMNLIQGESSEVGKLIEDPIHFLFIDGDHSYQAARADMKIYSPKIPRGFILGMHDIATTGAKRALHELMEDPSWKLMIQSCEPTQGNNSWTPGIAFLEKIDE